MKRQVSQRDLARIAGVSPMTVSLALRAHHSIPQATRERILMLAEQHHYRPDPALAALNAYRVGASSSAFQGTLAWVTAFDTRDGWRQMVQTTGYFEGAARRADQLGYRMEEFWIREPGINARRATQILMARGIRGLIVAPLPEAKGRIHLDWSQFSAVALGYSLSSPHLHVVMNSQFRNMKQVVQRLLALGHRRIGMAMPSANDERVDHNYLAGFWIAQQEAPPDAVRIKPLLAKTLDSRAFGAWFRRVKPDAIVIGSAFFDQVTEWLRQLGVRVPADVSLAVASIPHGNTHISGVDENVPLIGSHAVEAVVAMIHRNESGIPERPSNLLIEGVWSSGKTTRKRPAKTQGVV